MIDREIPLDIISGRPLSLTVSQGDGDRFARLLREVWSQLPTTVREQICDYWAKDSAPYVRLELSNDWIKCGDNYGLTGSAGCQVKFNASEVDQMPEKEAMFLIAHEFAHVYQYAAGIHRQSYDDLESDANDRAWEWGFDYPAWLNWKAKRELGLT